MKKLLSTILICILIIGMIAVPTSADEMSISNIDNQLTEDLNKAVNNTADILDAYASAENKLIALLVQNNCPVPEINIAINGIVEKASQHYNIMKDFSIDILSGNDNMCNRAVLYAQNMFDEVFTLRKATYDNDMGIWLISMNWRDDYGCTVEASIDGSIIGMHESNQELYDKYANMNKSTSEIKVMLNGQDIIFDVKPQIINDRTMVPMRAIFEALGYDVEWDGSEQKITAINNGDTIIMHIDSTSMYYNDKLINLDTAPMIINDRTLVPVRAISESSGYDVKWDGENRVVSISGNNKNNSEEINDSVLQGNTPEEAVEKLFAFLKTNEYLESQFSESDLEMYNVLMNGLTYRIVNKEQIESYEYNMKVEITSVDMGIVQQKFTEMVENNPYGIITSEELMDKFIAETLTQAMRETKDTVTSEVDIPVLKINGFWEATADSGLIETYPLNIPATAKSVLTVI